MAKKQKEQVLREVKLTDATKVVISSFIRENDGEEARFINVRKFYKKKSADDWMPDRQGIVLPYGKSKKVIKTLIECYKNAEEEAVPLPDMEKRK